MGNIFKFSCKEEFRIFNQNITKSEIIFENVYVVKNTTIEPYVDITIFGLLVINKDVTLTISKNSKLTLNCGLKSMGYISNYGILELI